MTTWLTTGEEESCGTENKGTAVNKYTCGRGAAHFLWSVFLLFCLYGMPPYFNSFIFQFCGNLNIFYSVLKRALLVKSPSSASLHRQNFNVTWQGPQNLYSIRDLNVNCGSFHSISKTVLPYILSQSLFYLPYHVYVHFKVQSYYLPYQIQGHLNLTQFCHNLTQV